MTNSWSDSEVSNLRSFTYTEYSAWSTKIMRKKQRQLINFLFYFKKNNWKYIAIFFTPQCQKHCEVFLCSVNDTIEIFARISVKSKLYSKILKHITKGPDRLESWKTRVKKSHDNGPLSAKECSQYYNSFYLNSWQAEDPEVFS